MAPLTQNAQTHILCAILGCFCRPLGLVRVEVTNPVPRGGVGVVGGAVHASPSHLRVPQHPAPRASWRPWVLCPLQEAAHSYSASFSFWFGSPHLPTPTPPPALRFGLGLFLKFAETRHLAPPSPRAATV